MRGGPLHVEQGGAAGAQHVDEVHQGHLRRVGAPMEHRLPGEQATDRHAVQPAGELAVGRPRLDAVRPPEHEQAPVCGADRAVDPAMGARRVRAGVDDAVEGRVDPHLVPGARAAQRPAHLQAVERQHPARVGRPPRHGARPTQGHREQAAAVGGEQGAWLEVGADPDDPRLVRRRGMRQLPPRGRRFHRWLPLAGWRVHGRASLAPARARDGCVRTGRATRGTTWCSRRSRSWTSGRGDRPRPCDAGRARPRSSGP